MQSFCSAAMAVAIGSAGQHGIYVVAVSGGRCGGEGWWWRISPSLTNMHLLHLQLLTYFLCSNYLGPLRLT